MFGGVIRLEPLENELTRDFGNVLSVRQTRQQTSLCLPQTRHTTVVHCRFRYFVARSVLDVRRIFGHSSSTTQQCRSFDGHPPLGAFPLRQAVEGSNRTRHDRTTETMGSRRQAAPTTTTPLPAPSCLMGATGWEKDTCLEALMEQQGWEGSAHARWPETPGPRREESRREDEAET